MLPRLRPFGDELWIAEGPIVDFHSFPYPTRMVVARLGGGALWVWSPIPLDQGLREEVGSLGRPAHLVSPNRLHHLFLAEWAGTFPDACLWGLPPVIRKYPELDITALGDRPPAGWRGEIDQVLFAGSVVMDEVVFFHRASRTAVFADLIENFDLDFLRRTPGWSGWRGWVGRHWGITEPFGMAPLEWRWSFLRRGAARRALAQILSWNPKRVVMAHGNWIERDGRAFVERSFRWLRRPSSG